MQLNRRATEPAQYGYKDIHIRNEFPESYKLERTLGIIRPALLTGTDVR